MKWCHLVVVGLETGGRWSNEAVKFVDNLASARARDAQPLLLPVCVPGVAFKVDPGWWQCRVAEFSRVLWSHRALMTLRALRAFVPAFADL